MKRVNPCFEYLCVRETSKAEIQTFDDLAAALEEGSKTGEFQVYVPDWGIHLQTKTPVGENLCGVGLRAHYFNPKARENIFPITFVDEREDLFEIRLLFKYEKQKQGTPDIWWRIPRECRPDAMPKELGIAPANVLLLYPE